MNTYPTCTNEKGQRVIAPFYNRRDEDEDLSSAYLQGEEANYAGVLYDDAPAFDDPADLAAWQAGWDDTQLRREAWETLCAADEPAWV